MAGYGQLVDAKVFEALQSNIDDDTATRDKLRDIVHSIEKNKQNLLPALISDVQSLATEASKHPYYKFNGMWTRQIQDAVGTALERTDWQIFGILLVGWIGGFGFNSEGTLLPIERVGQVLNGINPSSPKYLTAVPVNLTDRDAFHITVEDYLHALVSLLAELARLARNSVVLGNYERPLLISRFVKDVHAGFQLLNLKNDALRRRSDSIKYKIREVEDVVYDLSLRNLVPKTR